jgi:hypothetical protein
MLQRRELGLALFGASTMSFHPLRTVVDSYRATCR